MNHQNMLSSNIDRSVAIIVLMIAIKQNRKRERREGKEEVLSMNKESVISVISGESIDISV